MLVNGVNHMEIIPQWEGGGGLQNGRITGPKLVAPPPPQDRVKLFTPPPF